MSAFPALVIRKFDDFADAFLAVKNHLGLSHEHCEDLGGLTKGHVDKLLGPARAKRIAQMTFDTFCELFAVEFHMKLDLAAATRMQSRWEKRNNSQIRVNAQPLSMAVVERARPVIFSELARKSAVARLTKLSKVERSRIARNAARARWRKQRRVKNGSVS